MEGASQGFQNTDALTWSRMGDLNDHHAPGTLVPVGLEGSVAHHGPVYVFHVLDFYSRKHTRNGGGGQYRRLQKPLVEESWLACLHVGGDDKGVLLAYR